MHEIVKLKFCLDLKVFLQILKFDLKWQYGYQKDPMKPFGQMVSTLAQSSKV